MKGEWTTEAWALVETLYRKCSSGETRATAIGRSIVRELGRLNANGDPSAAVALMVFSGQAATHYAETQLRNEGVIHVGWNGTNVSVPARLSTPGRDSAGQAIAGARQYSLFMEWDEKTLLAKRQEFARQRDALSYDVQAIDHILRLIREHPGARTGREAALMAGLDPEDLAL